MKKQVWDFDFYMYDTFGIRVFSYCHENNQYNFFEDILSRYPEENIAGTLMVDLTHDGNDELLVISQDALEITLEIYAIIDGNPIVIYKDHASDNHAGWLLVLFKLLCP